MIKTIALLMAALIGLLLIYAATRPDSFRVERSITVASPPDKVFALVNNFHQWELWSPWEKVDPQIQRSYSGAPEGHGAIYAWQGNKDIGSGRVEIKIDFITPFEAHNTVLFTLVPQGQGTLVTQAMYGPSPFVSKLMGLVFSMDKMVGSKYEEGLATLKALAEK
jgi:hypothetical protein